MYADGTKRDAASAFPRNSITRENISENSKKKKNTYERNGGNRKIPARKIISWTCLCAHKSNNERVNCINYLSFRQRRGELLHAVKVIFLANCPVVSSPTRRIITLTFNFNNRYMLFNIWYSIWQDQKNNYSMSPCRRIFFFFKNTSSKQQCVK